MRAPEHPKLNPFPGLRAFREDEEYLFFGREHQVDTLVDKLAARHFLAVVGSSGCGKSSLINCGLRPALHRGLMSSAGSAWRMAQFRPGSDPVHALAGALAADGVLHTGWRGEVPLAEILETRLLASKRGLVELWTKARVPAGSNLLLVVDQFEELFRYRGLGGRDDDGGMRATAFVNLLLETLAQPDSRIHVVITMRSDFLGECARFHGLPEAINAGQYLVPRMSRDERRAAIAGPIGVGGAEIDPLLLTRLLNDVGEDPDQLSILQHALNRTWARWEDAGSRGPLTMAHYEAGGTMAQALDLHAEAAFATLPPALQGLCERVFRALTDKGTDARGIRRPTPLGRLGAIVGADTDAAGLRAVIAAFNAPGVDFLMPPASEPLHADTVIDISHESLMRVWKRLQKWSDQEALAAARLRRLAETARLKRNQEADYLRGPELERALDWRPRDRLEQAWAEQYGADYGVVVDFLQRSTEARDAELARERLRAEAEQLARERELQQTLALAEAQGQRADEQAAAGLRQRRFTRVLAVLLLVALALGLYGHSQRQKAEEESRVALSRELAAMANDQLNLGELRRAMQFAVTGYRVEPTRESRRSLHRALSAQPQLRTFLSGHHSEVWGVAFSPDGRLLASASTDQTVRLWDAASHQPVGAPLAGHRKPVWAVVFSPDGRMLASASSDRTVRLWDVATGQPLGEPLVGHGDAVWGVAFSPDGRTLASASGDNTVRLWDVATGQPKGEPLAGHSKRVWSVAFSPDGRTLASGSTDGTLRLWDVATRAPLGKPLDSKRGEVSGIAFSPDGAKLVTANGDSTLTLWDVVARRELGKTLKGHKDKVFSVAFSPDGQRLASTSGDKTVIVWNLANHQPLCAPFRAHQDRVFGVAFSPDGRTLASASGDMTVVLWDAEPVPRAGQPLAGHDSAVWGLAFSPNGSQLATSSWDQTVRLWDVANRRALGEPLKGHTDRVWGVAFHPGGRLLASASSDKTVRLWDVATQREIGTPLRGHAERVWSVAFSPDGRLLASASADRTVIVWDVERREPVDVPLREHTDRVLAVAFSPDGRLLASASGDRTVRLWDVATRQPVGAALAGHASAVWGIAFSPDSRLLASASGDRTVIVWDVASQKPLGAPLEGHQREVWGVAFDPSGKTLATASWDKTVILWDVATRSAVGDPFEQHGDRVWNVAFSPDGRTLASTSGDKTAILWDVKQVGLDVEASLRRACTMVGRNLTEFEWSHAVGFTTPYRAACPQMPVPSSAPETHENTLK